MVYSITTPIRYYEYDDLDRLYKTRRDITSRTRAFDDSVVNYGFTDSRPLRYTSPSYTSPSTVFLNDFVETAPIVYSPTRATTFRSPVKTHYWKDPMNLTYPTYRSYPALPTLSPKKPNHVVNDLNVNLQAQRVEVCEEYLEIINAKLIYRKKLLSSLMNLWHATKVHVTKYSSRYYIATHHDYSMPIQDIVRQTYEVQDLLLRDMQTRPAMRTEQLAYRVSKLRLALEQGIIGDYFFDEHHYPTSKRAYTGGLYTARNFSKRWSNSLHFQSLSSVLQHIAVAEESILASNKDCFDMIARILNYY